jgi:hypothetical protein
VDPSLHIGLYWPAGQIVEVQGRHAVPFEKNPVLHLKEQLSSFAFSGASNIPFCGLTKEHGLQTLSLNSNKGHPALNFPGPQELVLQGPTKLPRNMVKLSPGAKDEIVFRLKIISDMAPASGDANRTERSINLPDGGIAWTGVITVGKTGAKGSSDSIVIHKVECEKPCEGTYRPAIEGIQKEIETPAGSGSLNPKVKVESKDVHWILEKSMSVAGQLDMLSRPSGTQRVIISK